MEQGDLRHPPEADRESLRQMEADYCTPVDPDEYVWLEEGDYEAEE